MREVKKKAKVGEKIKIVDACSVPVTNGKPEYKNGDILTVMSVFRSTQVRYADGTSDDGKARVLNPDEYVVLEGENETRFKVGDKVRIVENTSGHSFEIGQFVRIIKVTGTDYYAGSLDGTEEWWVADKELEPAPFALSDLKPCMVIKYRGGELRIVAESTSGLILTGDGWIILDNFKEDLTTVFPGPDRDIVEVYGFSRFGHRANEISTEGRELLFKREEPKPKRKMTVTEICKELGEEIEIVKGE